MIGTFSIGTAPLGGIGFSPQPAAAPIPDPDPEVAGPITVWPANDIETKVEEALVAYLASDTGFTVYRGLETLFRGLPGVHAHCGSIVEVPLDTGNYQCEVDVVVTCKAQRDHDEDLDPMIDFRLRLATVRDSLNWTDLADRLSAAGTNFTCFYALDRGGGVAIDNDNFVATVKRELHVCGTAGRG